MMPLKKVKKAALALAVGLGLGLNAAGTAASNTPPPDICNHLKLMCNLYGGVVCLDYQNWCEKP